MTSFARYKPVYVSLSKRNTGIQNGAVYTSNSADNVTNTQIETNFNIPIVDKASDYLVAVERMELSLNGIPFYDGTQGEVITIRSRLNNALPVKTTAMDLTCWSLSHLLEQLGALEYTDPNDDSKFDIVHTISADGIIIIGLQGGKTFDMLQVEYPRVLNMILGMSTDQQIGDGTSYTEAESLFPRADLGDLLDHIVIETNLPTNSDSLGNAKMNVLTDFSVPSTYNNSLSYGPDGDLLRSSFSTSLRQRVIYVPNERRYLDLLGDFPILNIQCQAHYVDINGNVRPVSIPLGGYFEIKLGFYLKQ